MSSLTIKLDVIMKVIDYLIYKLVSGQSLTDIEHKFFSSYYFGHKVEVREKMFEVSLRLQK